jgi:hypothetical protein
MREALVAAPLYLWEHDWAKVRELLGEDNLLQSRTVSTGQRRAREVAERLAVLSDDEIELLADATTSERGHLLWAAACRRYALIAEFAEEVLRDHAQACAIRGRQRDARHASSPRVVCLPAWLNLVA